MKQVILSVIFTVIIGFGIFLPFMLPDECVYIAYGTAPVYTDFFRIYSKISIVLILVLCGCGAYFMCWGIAEYFTNEK